MVITQSERSLPSQARPDPRSGTSPDPTKCVGPAVGDKLRPYEMWTLRPGTGVNPTQYVRRGGSCTLPKREVGGTGSPRGTESCLARA